VDLRRRVDTLLEARQQAGESADKPSSSRAQTIDSEISPKPNSPGGVAASGGATTDFRGGDGALIAGRYVLENIVGEGGMGEVWRRNSFILSSGVSRSN
jgi:hypothetical protein